MSKLLRITPELREQCSKEIEELLSKTSYLTDGKLKLQFEKAFTSKERAKVVFTSEAWTKMTMLIQGFNSEVAWHGLVRRGNEEENEFIIYDILVYPQEVTGVNVVTDQTKYQEWLIALDDDSFNAVRMQGHSHVNMGVTPSGTDIVNQDKIIGQLEGDMFYIFMIWNKSHARYVKILDLKKNLLFETADVDICMEAAYADFMKQAKELVVEKATTSIVFPTKKTGAAITTTAPAKGKDKKSQKDKKKPGPIPATEFTRTKSPAYDYDDYDEYDNYLRRYN